MSDLQDLVDGLADHLGRPVGVDDRRLRSVAYSSHVDGIDPVRLASILQREAPSEVADWLDDLGIARASSYLKVPPNPELGMAARVCVPLRFDDRLLGFLWLIDSPTELGRAQLDRALAAAGDISVALYSQTQIEQSDREQERALLRSALGLDEGDQETAATSLVSRGLLASTTCLAVMSIIPHSGDEVPSDPIRARITAAVEHERRFAAPGRLLVLVEPASVYALVAFEVGAELRRHLDSIVARLEGNLADRQGWEAAVGVGGTGYARAHLAAAREEAELAQGLARHVPGLGPSASWDDLGAYRTLARATAGKDPLALLPRSLWHLLGDSEAPSLVPTLLAYLEHGGEARAAADELFIHRSSLYHRLRRIERVCGVELSSGDVRLELHLGLRLWRMAGEPRAQGPRPARQVSHGGRTTSDR